MQTVNIHEAKTQFSKLIESVIQGEKITIARAGQPVAMLISIAPQTHLRRPGALKDKIIIADDFDAPLSDELITLFEGK